MSISIISVHAAWLKLLWSSSGRPVNKGFPVSHHRTRQFSQFLTEKILSSRFTNRYGFSSHSDHSVAATASLKQLAVPVFHKHAQNNAYRGNLVEPIQCWLCWRFFDGRSNHDLSQSGKRSFYLFFFFLALNRASIYCFIRSITLSLV